MQTKLTLTLVIVLLASTLNPQASKAQTERSKRWAILIGVDSYNNAEDLKYCGDDMTALRKQLIASGFDEKRIFLLHNKAANTKYLPFKSNIEQQIELILKLTGPDDLVLLAYSGHGVQLGTTSYLCPTDAKLDDPKSLVSLSKVYSQLEDAPAALRLVLVDACRNDPREGGAKTFAGIKEVNQKFAKSLHKRPPEGVLLLTSCAAGEISWEDKKFGHGVFMHYLLEALQGKADKDRDGKISVNELIVHAGEETKLYVARRFSESQRPGIRGDLSIEVLKFDLAEVGQSGFTNSVGMKLVSIPAGEFKMGSGKSAAEIAKLFDSKEEYYKREHPQHAVRLSRGFYMSTTEVTHGQFEAVMGTTPWKGETYAKENAEHAASHISWEDATEYCVRLSKKEGRKYRLPTEAEWEHACRGGTTTIYSFGDDAGGLKDYAWFVDNADEVNEKYAHKVGQKRANKFGLYDMHGNVYEWCSDWYDEDYYAKSPSVDPKGPTSGSSRVLRGGSWRYYAQSCRSASRNRSTPTRRSGSPGFRLVCELD